MTVAIPGVGMPRAKRPKASSLPQVVSSIDSSGEMEQ